MMRDTRLSTFVAVAGLLIALASLLWQVYDHLESDAEHLSATIKIYAAGKSFVVTQECLLVTEKSVQHINYPEVPKSDSLEVDLTNLGRSDVVIRYVVLRFYDSSGRQIADLHLKPPPETPVPVGRNQVAEFSVAYSWHMVPSEATLAVLAVGTTRGQTFEESYNARYLALDPAAVGGSAE